MSLPRNHGPSRPNVTNSKASQVTEEGKAYAVPAAPGGITGCRAPLELPFLLSPPAPPMEEPLVPFRDYSPHRPVEETPGGGRGPDVLVLVCRSHI